MQAASSTTAAASTASVAVTHVTGSDDGAKTAERLHQAFGHASAAALRRLIKSGAVAGLPRGTPHHLDKVGGINCRACALGKLTKAQVANTIPADYLPTKPLECLVMDLIGPVKVGSRLAKNQYILVIVDVFTRYTWIYLLQSKAQTSDWIKYHIEMLERTFPEFKVKHLHADGGTEFQNETMTDFLTKKGLTSTVAPPYTATRNSVVERKNRQLLEMIRCLLVSANLPPVFWEYAAVYAVYIINRLVRRNGPFGTTPFEMLTGKKPKLKHIKVFGSDCVVYLRKEERDNKVTASMQGIYIGWYEAHRTHMVYSPETTNVFGTIHVQILEGQFKTPVNVHVKGYNNAVYDALTTKDVSIEGAYNYKLLHNTVSPRVSRKLDRESGPKEPMYVSVTLNPGYCEFGVPGEASFYDTEPSDGADASMNESVNDGVRGGTSDSTSEEKEHAPANVGDESDTVLPTGAQIIPTEVTISRDINSDMQSALPSSASTVGMVPEPTNIVRLPKGSVEARSRTAGTSTSSLSAKLMDNRSTKDTSSTYSANESGDTRKTTSGPIPSRRSTRLQLKMPAIPKSTNITGRAARVPTSVQPHRTAKNLPTNTVCKLIKAPTASGTDATYMHVLQVNNFKVQKTQVAQLVAALRHHGRTHSGPSAKKLNVYHVNVTIDPYTGQVNSDLKKGPVVPVGSIVEPSTMNQVMKSKQKAFWLAAARKEIDAQETNGVWALVPASQVPTGLKPIKCRWVFKVKQNADGTIDKYKARVVVKGYEQVPGIDFHDTYAPTLHLKSLKLMLALVAELDLELKQADYTTAFLNAPIEEALYMEQPPGFVRPPPSGSTDHKDRLVCKLLKSLYGTKQAPHNWNKMVHNFMLELGFRPLVSDTCVYVKRSATGRLFIISLYVDDKVIGYHKQDQAEWEALLKKIQGTFKIEVKEECQWILQMAIARDRSQRTLYLSQEKYVRDVVDRFRHLFPAGPDGKPHLRRRLNPTGSTKIEMSGADGTIVPATAEEINLYQQIIGSLMYAATHTRIDIAYVTGLLARYSSNPQPHHFLAALRVLEYLNSHPDLSLVFRGTSTGSIADLKLSIQAYSDADWAGCNDTRRSTTGTIILLNGNIIHWNSVKQRTVATSSTEAEYMALADTAKEIKWFNAWLKEVLLVVPQEFELGSPSTIHVDNTAAIALTAPGASHNRTKHIDVRYHFVREQVKAGDLQLVWINTTKQLADLLTKQLPVDTFKGLVSKLMVQTVKLVQPTTTMQS